MCTAGVLYTVNLLNSSHRACVLQVFCIQFYLGTTRLQLENKGDAAHHYTNFANVIVSFGFVVIPVIGWLLDHKGYGITLGTINCIGVIVSVLQAIPSLRLQVRLGHATLCSSCTRESIPAFLLLVRAA